MWNDKKLHEVETSFRPDWADCVVLVCARCRTRTKVSWEGFAMDSRIIYREGDMPERVMWASCRGRGKCGMAGIHFVDLDPLYLRRNLGPDVQELARSRACGCSRCRD